MKKVLLFSIALNGYQWRYASLLDTHKRYADRHQYEYVAVTKPVYSLLGMEIAWLKIRLIIEALQAGYETILFVDADTQVAIDAPPVERDMEAGKTIFAAKGFSGRFNSGVLLVQNSDSALYFFSSLLGLATTPIPDEDSVGWGENGHLIYLARQVNFFGELDPRWNNNHSPDMDDYIRHFSYGPLFQEYRADAKASLYANLCHYTLAVLKRLDRCINALIRPKENATYTFHSKLEAFTQRVLKNYPVFSAAKPSDCVAYSK